MLVLLASVLGASPAARSQTALEPAPRPLHERLTQIEKRRFDLSRELESLRLDRSAAERRFDDAEHRLDDADDDGPREEAGARRAELSTIMRREELLGERIARTEAERQAEQRLQRLRDQDVPADVIAEWSLEAQETLDSQERQYAVKRGRRDELEQEVTFARERIAELAPGDARERWASARLHATESLLDAYEREIASLDDFLALEHTLVTALDEERESLPLGARLRSLLHYLRAAWNYELTRSELEPITLGKIVSALLIFVIGWGVARVGARMIGERVLPRTRLDEGAANAVQALGFYLLLLVAFLTALRMVQIPLTAFAVVGGALAIGVGFGSQNVVNNFISGLILLVERPIKPGDLIDVEGVYGNVEQIGLRSTRIRTGDNVHIIVPNAAFLENNVTNWTHRDPKVRISISLGVVYGSDTREVERLILRAVAETQGVVSEPAPLVFFRDFGNDALIFETRFWIRMRTVVERLRVESDIRFRIDALFREAGIVIAFPQRDVHLDAAAPFEVRIVGEGGRETC